MSLRSSITSINSRVAEASTTPPRWNLGPNEFAKFKIQFKPTDEGHFKSEFLLTLLDNAKATYKIAVEGVADIPRLNMTPRCVFDRVIIIIISSFL